MKEGKKWKSNKQKAFNTVAHPFFQTIGLYWYLFCGNFYPSLFFDKHNIVYKYCNITQILRQNQLSLSFIYFCLTAAVTFLNVNTHLRTHQSAKIYIIFVVCIFMDTGLMSMMWLWSNRFSLWNEDRQTSFYIWHRFIATDWLFDTLSTTE